MKEYMLARLREGSTWRGIIAMLTAAGVSLQPDQQEAIISLGLAIMGVVGVFMKDQPHNP